MTFRPASALIFVALGLALTTSTPAFGHAAIVGTSPEKSATVSEITEVSVTANEELLDIGMNAKGFVLSVRDADRHFYGDGCVTVDGDTASMPVALTQAGRYTVSYRVVSNDGHPIEGSFSFRFAGTDGTDPAPAFADRPECGVAQDPIALDEPAPVDTEEPEAVATDDVTTAEFDLIPWIGLATIPLIIGAVVVLMRILGKTDSEDHLT